MPSPTPLQIATSSLNRLVKEERSYRVEAVEQERRIQKIVDSPPRRKDSANPYDNPQGNWEFEIRQNKRALEETKAVFPTLRKRIGEAMEKVEREMQAIEKGEGEKGHVDDFAKAKDAIAKGKLAVREISF